MRNKLVNHVIKVYFIAIMLVLLGAGCDTAQNTTNINTTKANKVDKTNQVKVTTSTKITTSSQKQIKQVKLYKVVSVVDGDTIKVIYNGNTESVRLVGIDTPETVHPTKPVQCFGKEASNKMKKLVEGKTVKLMVDKKGTERDKYKRLLRHIYLEDGTFVNKEMVKQGYAYAYLTYPFEYKEDFKKAESEAKKNKLGLWADGVCNNFSTTSNTKTKPVETKPESTTKVEEQSTATTETTSKKTNEVIITPVEEQTTVKEEEKAIPKASCDCSGNVYNCSDFSTHNEAQSIYDCCGGVSNDIHRLDRDGDGSACETLP